MFSARAILLTFMTVMTPLPLFAQGKITVYAAASTQPVIDALIPVMAHRNISLTAVYAGSATLARQIEWGAEADVYITANKRWMDALAAKGLIEPTTKNAIASNRLVLISHTPLSGPDQTFGPGYPLASLLGDGRLAIGDPDHVPAGRYGREALMSIGAWESVKDRLAPTKDVTGALMLVARGEVRLGVVYKSDAQRTAKVQIFKTFPKDSHSPIVYQAAALKGHLTQDTQTFLKLLVGTEGQAAFLSAGFGPRP